MFIFALFASLGMRRGRVCGSERLAGTAARKSVFGKGETRAAARSHLCQAARTIPE